MKALVVRILLASCVLFSSWLTNAAQYTNFAVSIYCRSYEVRQMNDLAWLTNVWTPIAAQLRVDKIYLETHRDDVIPSRETLVKAKGFFESRGVRAAAGIATVANERNLFQSFCYSSPADRRKLREVVELSAGVFDEIILDDFFYSNCKCEDCVRAKGGRSWTEFRLEQLDDVARDVVVKPARAVRPNVKVVLKYPNWYEHYQGLGYNLASGPRHFDGIYTGTETREPFNTEQHLQQYQGYLIFRYLENVMPGRNGGGWVDTGGMRYADRYAEQLWLTLFAKAPEITLFDWRQVQRELRPEHRAQWQGQHPSFDFDRVMASVRAAGEAESRPATIARAAGYVFDQVDSFLGKLGNPVGLAAYKPLHSVGEDYLHAYLGMAGMPIELTPEFPVEAGAVFLAESAGADASLVGRIERQLRAGKDVIMTSGLLRALQGKGIEEIAEIRYTDRKVAVRDFVRGYAEAAPGKSEILIPAIDYITNDAWALASGSAAGIPFPLLLQAKYAQAHLYVLTVPENFGDIYNLPPEVLNAIRTVFARNLFVRLEGPSQVALFVYDNDTFIVESFLPEATQVTALVAGDSAKLRNLVTGEKVEGQLRGMEAGRRQVIDSQGRTAFSLRLPPHSYAVFAVER